MGSVVRSEDVAPQPWAAGRSTIRELARGDDGAWRIGLAEVTADGPVPTSAGTLRVLTVVDGPVLDLEVDDEAHVVEPQRPFALPGDAAAVASVPEGAVRALDVVVDPTLVRPFVTVLELGRSSALPLAADQAAYVVSGTRDAIATGTLVIGPGEVTGRCTVAVVTLERIG
ncbi:HutD family protein [Nocardioides sp. zg-1228]|uniref:HutD family protein n=1 Tax=Nocardioides sp. zg-1228 TaxID=2763008 RepID=UPI00164312AF|nr:HutD family protein [Nocardioides sp. zg-1228]MBC2934160.1 HutD family protein [Nocardioides sp. zg-1228]QSF58905.1 HutD family protein [Nocardioides sp. zg-1228]